MSQFFASGGQSVGASASAVLPVNIQDWSPLGWAGRVSLQPKGLSGVSSSTQVDSATEPRGIPLQILEPISFPFSAFSLSGGK